MYKHPNSIIFGSFVFGLFLLTVRAEGKEGVPLSEAQRLAQETIERRSQQAELALQEMKQAEELVGVGRWAEASSLYSNALGRLSEAEATSILKAQIIEGFCFTTIKQAKELAAQGSYEQASKLLDELRGSKYTAYKKQVDALSKKLADADYYNPALSKEFQEKVEEVSLLLLKARDQVNLGQFDEALGSYNQVLRLDRYNAAARSGLAALNTRIAEHHESSRNHSRAKLLAEVDASWEAAVPVKAAPQAGAEVSLQEGKQLVHNRRALKELVIDRVEFFEADLVEAVSFLVSKSRSLGSSSQGVNIVVRGGSEYEQKKVSLNLSALPLEEVLRYLARLTDMRYRLAPYAIELVPLTQLDGQMITRSYAVPPYFLQSMPVSEAQGEDVFAETASQGARTKLSAAEFLQAQGIVFPEGGRAWYDAGSSTLTVRNTPDNLDYVEQLVDNSNDSAPKQVEVRVKMIEVSQNTLGELGYDWLLGEFDIGNDKVFGSGGTTGNQQAATGILSFPQGIFLIHSFKQ